MWKADVVWEKHVQSHVVVVLRVAKTRMLCVVHSIQGLHLERV